MLYDIVILNGAIRLFTKAGASQGLGFVKGGGRESATVTASVCSIVPVVACRPAAPSRGGEETGERPVLHW